MSAVEQLQTTELYKYLKKQNAELASDICTFVEHIEEPLATIEKYFPLYTRHDVRHGKNVVDRMAQILTPESLKSTAESKLSAHEIWLLIAAAYAHDIGMTVLPGEEADLKRDLDIEGILDWETHPALQKYLRTHHSTRGRKYIAGCNCTSGVPLSLRDTLSKMMAAHNMKNDDLRRVFTPFTGAGYIEIDTLQLAIILCIADLLEFSDDRVIDDVFDRIAASKSPEAAESYRENMKNACIGSSLFVNDSNTVAVSGTFDDPEVLALAHDTFDKAEEYLRGYLDLDYKARHKRLRINAAPFARNLELLDGDFERIGVRLNKKNILDLISSRAVWKDDKGVGIRELVQNSAEACRYRRFNTSESYGYVPKVTIDFDRANHSVMVTDNGCGMSRTVILEHFLNVGNSRSRQSEYQRPGFDSFARFGIGFWSVFSVAHTATVKTVPFDPIAPDASASSPGKEFNVSMDKFTDYTVLRDTTGPSGTTVTLHLHREIVLDDVFNGLLDNVRCPEIAITVTLDGHEWHLPCSVMELLPSDLFAHRTEETLNTHNVKTFQWKGSTENTELSLIVAYFQTPDGILFRAPNGIGAESFAPNMKFMNRKISVCGFRTRCSELPFCLNVDRIGSYHANYLKPGGVEFSLDRGNMVENDVWKSFQEDIFKLLSDGYRKFLQLGDAHSPARVFDLNNQVRKFSSRSYTRSLNEMLSMARRYCPDLLCFKSHEILSAGAITTSHADLENLLAKRGKVFVPIFERSVGWDIFGLPEGSHLTAIYRYAQEYFLPCSTSPLYLMPSGLESFLLFDADSEGSVIALPTPIANVCTHFLVVDLARVRTGATAPAVFYQVAGQWSGDIYIRDLNSGDGKPYTFFRPDLTISNNILVIKRHSRLHLHLNILKENRQIQQLSKLVFLLYEDSLGHRDDSIVPLLL